MSRAYVAPWASDESKSESITAVATEGLPEGLTWSAKSGAVAAVFHVM
jgi:hypothetical protein